MERLTAEKYRALRRDAEVVERDAHGEKVLRLASGEYLKLFRVKRLFSSARLFPYSRRFARNAETLRQRGIPTVKNVRSLRIPDIKRTGVLYSPLPGKTFRQLDTVDHDTALALGEFIASLHLKGIYFRSLHLGNIVLTPEKNLGLIDIADMRFLPVTVPRPWCTGNLNFMLQYPGDRARLKHTFDGFCAGYSRCHPNGDRVLARLSPWK
jgi:tRNA A-37 threonylcarbamoyl transferase component Bud32